MYSADDDYAGSVDHNAVPHIVLLLCDAVFPLLTHVFTKSCNCKEKKCPAEQSQIEI